MAFEPFNYGNVLAQGENILAARRQRDPNSPQNQMAQLQVDALKKEANAQPERDPAKDMAAMRAAIPVIARMKSDPSFIPQGVKQLQEYRILGPEFSTQGRNVMELHSTLPNLEKSIMAGLQAVQALDRKPESSYTLGPGQTRYDADGNVLAQAEPRPPTYGAPISAIGPDGKPTYIRPDSSGGVAPVEGYAPPEKTPTTIINTGEDAERKEVGQNNAKWFDKTINAADAARETIYQVDQMESIDIDTGALEPAKAAFAAAVEGLGFDANGIANATNAQAFTAISNRLVNKVLNEAKGPQTEGDAQRAKSTIASLGNTPQARKFINASLKATALRSVEMAEFIERRVYEGERIAKARMQWREYTERMPNLSDQLKTPEGLPMYFYQFKEAARRVRPEMTDEQLAEQWRLKHGR